METHVSKASLPDEGKRGLPAAIAMAAIIVVACAPMACAKKLPEGYEVPPPHWGGPVFHLSQRYPASLPPRTTAAWESINFNVEPEAYLRAVVDYCFAGFAIDGGDAKDAFLPEKNTVRQWFHAPWLVREFVHGLTVERASQPYELATAQTLPYASYAVGFYNDFGGYTLGQVWSDPENPQSKAAQFPEGTVSFKLLFTTAPEEVVPWLKGAPEWYADYGPTHKVETILGNKARLLQVDIAVKDGRSKCGGWIFGSFHYDSTINQPNPWRRLRPLVLMWGDDPDLTPEAYLAGARPKEEWINHASPLVEYRQSNNNVSATLGWAGRGNGPVDNPASSCLSCHSTAEDEPKSDIIPPQSWSVGKLRWFRDLAPSEPFDSGQVSLDFSLQLAAGIRNFKTATHQPMAERLLFMQTSEAIGPPERVPAPDRHPVTRDPPAR